MSLGDLTSPISTPKNSDEITVDKLELSVSISGEDTDFETVGYVSNETVFRVNKTFLEWMDGNVLALKYPQNEQPMIEGELMQTGNAKLVAIALGKSQYDADTTGSGSDKVYLTSTPEVPPKYKWKGTGKTADGKDIRIIFLKGQVTAEEVTMNFGGDISGTPITIEGTMDPSSTESYDVGVIEFDVS